MVILIVYLTLTGLVLLFAFIHLCYLVVSLEVFHILFDHYIEQKLLLLIKKQSLGDLQSSCSLNQS